MRLLHLVGVKGDTVAMHMMYLHPVLRGQSAVKLIKHWEVGCYMMGGEPLAYP